MPKPLTPLEQQLQQYAPEMFNLYMLMKDEMDGGGGERKLNILFDALLKYNQQMATGKIYINYSKGKIQKIEGNVDMTAGTGLPRNQE